MCSVASPTVRTASYTGYSWTGGGGGGCWERLLSGHGYCTEEGLPVLSPLDPSKDTGFLRSWALGNLSTGTSTGTSTGGEGGFPKRPETSSV